MVSGGLAAAQGNTSQLFDILASMPALQQIALDGLSLIAGSANEVSPAGNSLCSIPVRAVFPHLSGKFLVTLFAIS